MKTVSNVLRALHYPVKAGQSHSRAGRRELVQPSPPDTFRCFPDGVCGNRLAPMEIQRVAFETQPDKLLSSVGGNKFSHHHPGHLHVDVLGGLVAAYVTPEIDEPFIMWQIKGRARRIPQGTDHCLCMAFEPDHVGDVAIPARVRQSAE